MIMRMQATFRDGSTLTGPATETENGGLTVHGIPVSQDRDLTPAEGVTAIHVIEEDPSPVPYPTGEGLWADANGDLLVVEETCDGRLAGTRILVDGEWLTDDTPTPVDRIPHGPFTPASTVAIHPSDSVRDAWERGRHAGLNDADEDENPYPSKPIEAGDFLTCESGNTYRATGRGGYHHVVAVNPDTGDETYIPRDRIIRVEHVSA